MYYFNDNAGNVFAFADESDAPEDLLPCEESKALALAAGSTPEIDYPALISAERYKREVVGITVDSFVINTTRGGQALIAGAALSAMIDPGYTCNWKTDSGFVELNASQLVKVATAVRAHVQTCFDRELTLLRAIEAGNYGDYMLTEGWPDSASDPVPDPAPKPGSQ